MIRVKELRRWLPVLIVAAAVLLPSVLPVSAQQGSGGSGIQIVPTRTEVTVGQGESRDITITLRNVTSSVIIAKGFVHDFEPDNETGEPQIIVDPTIKTAFSLKDYVKNLADYELQPNETKDVTLSVNIPTDAAPGGYYGVIRYAAVPKEQADNAGEKTVALTASVASLLLVQVPGDVTESIRVDKVVAELDGRESSFFTKGPNKANVYISNTGNSFVKPFGIVTVKKGTKEIYSYQLNSVGQRGNVLPKSSRVFKQDIQNTNSFGRYVITANVSYTDGGEVITISKSFWVIPLWVIIVAGAISLLIVILIIYISLRLRSRRHRVRHR